MSLRHLLTPAVLSECSGLIDCDHLCLNKFRNGPFGPLYLEFLEQHRTLIRWEKFGRVFAVCSLHEPFSRQLLESVADAAAWRELSSDEGIPEEVYQSFPGRIDWEAISMQPREFSRKFLDRFKDYLNWDSIVEKRLQSHQRRTKISADDFLDSVPEHCRESGKKIWAEHIGYRLGRNGSGSILHQNVREEAFWARCYPSPGTALPAESPQRLAEWLDLPSLFYPGSGIDVSPALLFANWGMVRTIVHADYWLTADAMKAACDRFEQFGWRRESEGHVTPKDLGGENWEQFFRNRRGPAQGIREDLDGDFRTRAFNYGGLEYGFFESRGAPARSRWTLFKPAFEAGLPNSAHTSGVMFLQLCVEAIHTCWYLWGQTSQKAPDQIRSNSVRRPPMVVVLQDHGLGGQWASFGGPESLLASIFQDTGYPPDFLFVGDWTRPWSDYFLASPSFHCHLSSGGNYHRTLYHASHICRPCFPDAFKQ